MTDETNQRIIELERKVEYLERVVQALAHWKKDKVIEVIETDEKWKTRTIWLRSEFENEMKKVWTYNEYFWI